MTLHTAQELVLDTPQRLSAIADETRSRILRTLQDGPASAKQLSELLGMSHGKIGYHVKVLREAGLIEVVEERPVRALTERFYGLTFDRLSFALGGADRLQFTLAQAAREADITARQPFDPPALFVTARISPQRAAEFNEAVSDLVTQFAGSSDPAAEDMFGLVAGVFLTDTPRREGAR